MQASRDARDTDRRRAERVKAGDADAFAELFEAHRRGLLAYVAGMLCDRELAEEIVQDCFVRLVGALGRINPERGVSGWLYRTARNRTIDVLRRRKFEISYGDDLPGGAPGIGTEQTQPTPIDELMADETRGRVRRCLNRLPERERDLLMLRFYGGLTFREAAQALGRPLGTVLWQARKSMARLREMLSEEEARG
jgi:RNA polymerase sigma-70 factor, ECF subfamily